MSSDKIRQILILHSQVKAKLFMSTNLKLLRVGGVSKINVDK